MAAASQSVRDHFFVNVAFLLPNAWRGNRFVVHASLPRQVIVISAGAHYGQDLLLCKHGSHINSRLVAHISRASLSTLLAT